jgi:hypothetical protein
MEIDTAFMLFCLYDCRTEIKIILLLFNLEKKCRKAALSLSSSLFNLAYTHNENKIKYITLNHILVYVDIQIY